MPPQSWEVSRRIAQPVFEEDAPVAIAAPTPFWDQVTRSARASAVDQWRNRTGGWREHEWRTALLKRHDEVRRITGENLRDPAEALGWAVGPEANRDGLAGIGVALDELMGAPARWITGDPDVEDYEAQLDALRARYPALARIPTREQLWRDHDADLRRVRREAEEAASLGPGGAVAGFVGGTASALADPTNLGATLATGGLGAGRGLLTRMGAQALANAGIEAVQTPGRAVEGDRYGGPEYSAGEAALDLVTAAVGGAGFEALAAGGGVVFRQVRGRFGGSPDPVERGLADQVERLLDDQAVIGPAAEDFDGARAALARGDLRPESPPERDLADLFGDAPATVRNPLQPGSAALEPGLAEAEYHGRRIWAGRFDPLTVEADAARFQYKADGDAEGVTGRLRGVERWDATASGKAILFEEADGRLIVADGHQRRGLARRLAEQGWEDAQLDGYLFREVDGWTARDVRVVAALKNIREGSGAVMDAAKVFRDAPAALNDRSLPVTGDFIHQARQLASLSDDGFRAVVNGVIPERFGAVIGEQAAGRPELHGDLVELVRRGEPRSIEGARALVQEGLLDDFLKSEGRQLDLFGGLPRESTVIARGRIREAVLAGLRRDEKLNAALVRNADAIEAGGNVLARSENEARLAVDRAASELVSRLALRSGEMGEAFAQAAAAVTTGEATAGAAAKGLLQRIRAAVAAGERLDEARAEVLNPSAPSAAALQAVDAFDAPGGSAQRAQIEAKPEDLELEGPDTMGLFDDLPSVVHEERALSVLKACAPGGA